MNSVISYLIPRKVKNYFEYRTVKKEWKKLHKETKRKWKEDYERRKLEIEAEMKFKKKSKKKVTFRGDVGVREEYIVYELKHVIINYHSSNLYLKFGNALNLCGNLKTGKESFYDTNYYEKQIHSNASGFSVEEFEVSKISPKK
ncbi:hypothetical protein Glove_194g105 [Diversispora epigaea]|uniref:Uncharacterized protein n=1 Tax=Diversispora epigaea TaxID=1348612 RepID=A0A397IP50_9GLOM|nr:hypothetical protein Glove_194g105 [Diversispora epigaea]